MEALIDFLSKKMGAKRVATLLAVLQVIVALLFAHYKNQADAQLTATQVQALASVRRAIDQAADIAAQDAELTGQPQPPQGEMK